MKDLAKKVAVGLATGALVAQTMVLPSFATITVIESGNGSGSTNDADVSKTNTTAVQQSNTANISNHVDANASSGGNEVKGNTGGNVSVDTGSADSKVAVKNTVNSNEAQVACGGCQPDLRVQISGNGSDSKNQVDLDLTTTTQVDQSNWANLDNHVTSKANSGDNKAKDNTGGNVSIDTGDASAWAGVTNKANANVAQVGNGGNGGGALDLLITGNGSKSSNDIDTKLSSNTYLAQDNWADISNDVLVKANTGENDAKNNTGGSASISTGDAEALARVDNLANFNAASVDCCATFDGLVKVAGNGSGSHNDVDLDLASTLVNTQDNVFSCGNGHEWGFLDWGWDKNNCNDVTAKADTGKNKLKDNTGTPHGDPSIDTGSASDEVVVQTTGNSNVFSTGDALPTPPPVSDWMGSNWNGWFWLLSGSLSH